MRHRRLCHPGDRSDTDYSGELAVLQQALSRSSDMAARRDRVVAALNPLPGDRVLEAGCGGGLLLRRIAVAVGEGGSAVGIDLSPDQVAAARAHCAALQQATVVVGDVRSVPSPDGCFDAVVSTQVLEYVPEVEAAVVDLGRVTRHGGRFVNVATIWGSLFWEGGEEGLTRQVMSVWDGHAPHPNLPTALPRLLADSGFGDVDQHPITILNRDFHPGTFAFGIAQVMAGHARVAGAVDDAEARAWLASLAAADERGAFSVSVIPVLTTATRLGA